MKTGQPVLVAVAATAVTCIIMTTSTISIVMPEDALDRAKALDGNLPLDLEYVGQADGKYFFVEVNRTMSWTMADDYCKSIDMTLASIETKNQLDALNEGLQPYNRHHYWTSGREYRHPSSIVWDGTENSLLNMTIFPRWSFLGNSTDREFQYCLLFYATNDNDQYYIYVTSCNNRSAFRVICQGT